jgi:hypothetical protein
MNSKRTPARERRLAAVHEAGHVVIARRVGFKIASAWIMPNDGEEAEHEGTWTGRVQIESVRADKFACRMVGVAGSVAEHLWLGGSIDDYFPDTLPEGDWHLTGCDPDQPDDAFMEAIGEVGQLLARGGSGWQELITESRWLIVASRPSIEPTTIKQRSRRATARPVDSLADSPAAFLESWLGIRLEVPNARGQCPK